MKKTSLILVLSLFTTFGFSQMVSKTTGTPSDLKKMKTKILAVEILEEGSEEDLSNMDSKEKEDYKALIKSYNQHIKKAVEKVWNLNDNIEYKNSTEIDAIIKNKNEKYALLTYYKHSFYMRESILGDKSFYNYADVRYRHRNESVCVINYVSPSSDQQNPELHAGLPARFTYEDKQYREKDLVFTLRNLQNNINEIIKTNKHIKPNDYIKNTAKLNCHQLSTKTFLLNKSETVKKFNLEKAKKFYAYKLKKTDLETIELAVANKETDKAYSILLPFAFKGQLLLSYKLVVDAVSGDILSCSQSMSVIAAMSAFIPADLKKFSKCQ